jgi:hypothetical protein
MENFRIICTSYILWPFLVTTLMALGGERYSSWELFWTGMQVEYFPYEVILVILKTKTKLRGRSPQANYTHRATAACRRS